MTKVNDFLADLDLTKYETGHKIFVHAKSPDGILFLTFIVAKTLQGFLILLDGDERTKYTRAVGKAFESYELIDYLRPMTTKKTWRNIRVYVVNLVRRGEKYPRDMSDEEFMQEAKEQGTVYTLRGFADKFNKEIDSSQQTIRII